MPIIYLSKVHDYITDEYYYSVDHHKDSIPSNAVKFTWYVLKDTVDLYSVIALLQQTLSPVEINIMTYSYHSEYDMPLYGPIAPDVDLEFPYWTMPSYAAKADQIKAQPKIFGYEALQGDILIDRDGCLWEVLRVTAKRITWRPMFVRYPKWHERSYKEVKELRKKRYMSKFYKHELFYRTQDRSFIATGMKLSKI